MRLPNKGMKLTKPGELRRFAAYPRCWADLQVERSGPGQTADMKYKRIKSALHNLGDSFLGLTNYFHDVYVLDELNELTRRSPMGVVIDLSAGTITPDPGPAKRLREAVAAYRDRLAAHFHGEGVDVAKLTDITLHYCPTARSRGTVSAVDDRGTHHRVPV